MKNDLWKNEEIKAAIPAFLKLYAKKPIADNEGGMNSPHMFATWFILKKIEPKYIIESGVYKGQSTWLFENTVPDSKIFSIDINLNQRKYISEQITYFEKDFNKIEWSFIPDKENAVLFFDDHQNAFERVLSAHAMGFKKFIFEDNYPPGKGDSYSLKQVFEFSGFKPVNVIPRTFKALIKFALNFIKASIIIEPNQKDAKLLNEIGKTYFTFPPVFTNPFTRWGDEWNNKSYITPEPLFKLVENDSLRIFKKEAGDYNWLCYFELK